MKIFSSYKPATSSYGAHMGICNHFPAIARAYIQRNGKTTAELEISAEQYPNLEPNQLTEKAIAILRTIIQKNRAT